MNQRVYYGNINPHALADYLVESFRQPPYYQHSRTMAQKIIQGERIFVQVMRTSDWGSSKRRAISLYITSFKGGINIEMGAADWLDVDEAGLAGMLLGALFFPPLLLFPLIQGLAGSNFSADVWEVIDTYCVQVNNEPGPRAHTPQGFYCTYCGAFNHPGAPRCHSCHAPFQFAPQQQSADQPPAEASTPPPAEPAASAGAQAEVQPEASAQEAESPAPPAFAFVVCPNCNATVMPARFCGNCAAPLPAGPDASGV